MKKQLWIWIFLLGSVFCRAEQPVVIASLSSKTVEPGEEVQLEIRVTGGKEVEQPGAFEMAGVEIAYVGQQQQSQVNITNGQMTSSCSKIFTYNLLAQRSGKFTVPAIKVMVDGQALATEPLQFEVGGGSDNGSPEGQLAFAEIVTPKNTAYVGEAIPVELRFYVDSKIRAQVEQLPSFSAEGFTIQKLSRPNQTQITRDGRQYALVSFKTALTPVKAGKLTINPSELPCLVQLPEKRRRPRTGVGTLDDFFNNDFFASQLQPTRRMVLKTGKVEMEVKGLPEGAPPGFAGAVGQFELSSEASPLKVKVADPITLRLKVTGRGNLDRISAPEIGSHGGWKSYPPSSKIESDDELGISGAKTFEVALVPQEAKTEIPEALFSFFDPVEGTYKSLKSAPITVEISPNATVPSALPATSTARPVESVGNDILHIQYEMGPRILTFMPVYQRRGFWYWQAVPGGLLVGFLVYSLLSRRRALSNKLETQIRKEKSKAMHLMETPGVHAHDFYGAAVLYLQWHAVHGFEQAPSSLDAAQIAMRLGLNESTAAVVKELFETAAALRYSGEISDKSPLSATEQARVVSTLKQLEETYANA